MVSDLGDEIAETDTNPVLVCGEGEGCRCSRPARYPEEEEILARTIKNPCRLFWQGFFVLKRDHFGQSIFIPGGIYPCFSIA